MSFPVSRRVYRRLLGLLGGGTGRRHAPEMEHLFASMLRRETSRRGLAGWIHVWAGAVVDLLRDPVPLKKEKGVTMASLGQDLKFGWRVLAKNPGFTVVAVVTLALGIGANSAIFSLVNATLLAPLPFPEAKRLVAGWTSVPKLGFDTVGFSPPDYRLLAERQDIFEDIGAVTLGSFELSGGDGPPRRVVAFKVTSGYFRALAVPPLHGRWLLAGDDEPGRPVVVLSGTLWRERYGADPSIVGRSILLDRRPYQVVGVMPSNFQVPVPGLSEGTTPGDIWIPRGFTADELQAYGSYFSHMVVARLKPGVSQQQMRSQAEALAARAQEAYPPQITEALGSDRTLFFRFIPLFEQLVGDIRTPLLVLQAAVFLVLLIGCANVANLLLVQASARRRELALRSALGAGRGRLVSQMLWESLLLGLLGGGAGLLLAEIALPLLRTLIPPSLPQSQDISIDLPVLAFTFLLSLGTTLLFALIPAWKATRSDVQEALREGGRQGAGGASNRLQGVFVVAQMTLAIVLLVVAGLLLRSFSALVSTDPGFQPGKVVTTRVELPLAAYPQPQQIRSLYDALLQRLQGLPSVRAVGASTDLPLQITERRSFRREDEDPTTDTMRSVVFSWMTGDYLQAMGIRLLKGRPFSPQDRAGTQLVALVSRTAAQQLFSDRDPLGARVFVGGRRQPYTVVGVIEDVKDRAMDEPTLPHVYAPYEQEPDGALLDTQWNALRALNIAVRTGSDPADLLPLVRGQLQEVDPQLALSNIRTMETDIAQAVAPQRFNTLLLSIFATTALFLAVVGIYGVISYSVNQRRQEMGIRMALGAQQSDLLKLVLARGIRLVGASLVFGVAAALALSHLISGLLYNVGSRDPLTFSAVLVLLAAVALLACLLPARRAAKVDPMQALRTE